MTAWTRCFIIQRPSTGRVDAKHCCGGNLAGLAAQETCIDGAETNFASRKQANAPAGKNCAVRKHIFLPKEMFPSVALSSLFVTLATLKT